MSALASLLGRLGGKVSDRDGKAGGLQEAALEQGMVAARHLARETTALRAPSDLIEEALAEKVLGAWMANRHQTLFPLAINFRRLPEAHLELLCSMLAVALNAADAESARTQLPQLRAWLRTVGGDDATLERIEALVASPPPLSGLFQAIGAAGLGPYAYSVSLAAVDHRVLANRLFLEYVAARLAVPSDMARSLAQRFRS